MKKFAQCLMCEYAFGRKCNKTGQPIPDEIYNNEKKCECLNSLTDTSFDVDDPCCCENKRYESLNQEK